MPARRRLLPRALFGRSGSVPFAPVLCAGLLSGLVLAGCGTPTVADDDEGAPAAAEGDTTDTGDERPDPDATDAPSDGSATDGSPATDQEEADAPPDEGQDGGPTVDPAEVGADELGVVPVMMYHQLREDGGSDWDMTPDELRAEFVRLFESGYVPIRAKDLARGTIDVPAGTSPVVLTFDDAVRSQAYLDEQGELAADTSIGILTEVAADFEHVEPVATYFIISSSLFGGTADGPDTVAALHEHGVELGNHSHTHANLSSLDDAGVQEELATNVSVLRGIVADAQIATLSLPYGISPENPEVASSGDHDGVSYQHDGVFLVGDRPAPSPYSADFDPARIPRIKTLSDPEAEFGSAWWLDLLEESDHYRRYVSDGDPTTISFPSEHADALAPAFADDANPY